MRDQVEKALTQQVRRPVRRDATQRADGDFSGHVMSIITVGTINIQAGKVAYIGLPVLWQPCRQHSSRHMGMAMYFCQEEQSIKQIGHDGMGRYNDSHIPGTSSLGLAEPA